MQPSIQERAGQGRFLYIPDNDIIEEENVYLSMNGVVDLLRKYHDNGSAVYFIADMLEE